MENDSEEKIMTLNLDGKKGVNILLRRYAAMKDSVLAAFKNKEQVTLVELNAFVEADLKDKFDGKIGWYLMAVKLDLEARGEIEKIPKVTPQTLRLVK